MKGEKGVAMVVAITLIGLLSSLGLYLILESGTSSRISKSMIRSEEAFNLADGGSQLGIYCISKSPPSPSFGQLQSTSIQTIPTTQLYKYMQAATLGSGGSTGTYTPTIDYVGRKSTPPPGWMLNWQGYSNFYSLTYRARGQGSIPLPASQGGAAQSRVSSVALRVMR